MLTEIFIEEIIDQSSGIAEYRASFGKEDDNGSFSGFVSSLCETSWLAIIDLCEIINTYEYSNDVQVGPYEYQVKENDQN